MALTIRLSTFAETRLAELATAAGWSPAEYASRLVERAVSMPDAADALTAFRRQVAQSGMSEPQLDAFFEELRDQVWQERSQKSADPGDGGGKGKRAA